MKFDKTNYNNHNLPTVARIGMLIRHCRCCCRFLLWRFADA